MADSNSLVHEASYEFLCEHLEREDPLSYYRLSPTLQEDYRVAKAAIRGMVCLLDDRGEYLVETGTYYYPLFCFTLEALCRGQPTALFNEVDNFRAALVPISDPVFNYCCIDALNQRGIEDDVYQQLVSVLVFDDSQTFYQESTYTNLLDCMKSNAEVVSRIIRDIPSQAVLEAIPQEVLCEEHILIAICFGHPNADLEGTAITANMIPERFSRARLLAASLQSHGGLYGFSFPVELAADREFCLSCLSAASKDLWSSELQHIWLSFPEELRVDTGFVVNAISVTIKILPLLGEQHPAAFEAWLAAIKNYGYRETLLILKNQSRSVTGRCFRYFERRVKDYLDNHASFMVFLGGFKERQKEPICDGVNLLQLLDCSEETTTFLKKDLGEYAGVPTGRFLSDLRVASELQAKFRTSLIHLHWGAYFLNADDQYLLQTYRLA